MIQERFTSMCISCIKENENQPTIAKNHLNKKRKD